MNKKLLLLLLSLGTGYLKLHAQHTEIYPTNWWTEMKMNRIQLLVRSDDNGLTAQNIGII